MSIINCCCKTSCTLLAIVASVVLGIVAAFLQIAAVITVTPVFLWVALGIAVVYLGILLTSATLSRRTLCRPCVEGSVTTTLVGILGAILFSAVLLAVGITATSVVSAILVGLLAGFLTLVFTGSACLIRCLTECEA